MSNSDKPDSGPDLASFMVVNESHRRALGQGASGSDSQSHPERRRTDLAAGYRFSMAVGELAKQEA